MGGGYRKAEAHAELERRDANTYLAGRSTDLAEQRRQGSERQLGIEEGLLGTDAQVQGQLGGVNQELLPYLSRYQFDSAAANLKYQAFTTKKVGTDYLQQRADAANQLMQQAEDAARGGDMAGAEKLRQQAQQSLTQNTLAHNELAGLPGLDQMFTLVEDPATAARARLGSPEALLVGKQLQEARSFQDFNSEGSVNERRIMSEAGERSIAAAQRTAERQGRNAALGGGSAQSAYGRQLGQERAERQFGQDRAQLFAGVAQNFQNMARQYGKDSVSFAQAYLQNQSGIRSDFQNALDSLKTNFAQLAQQTAQMNQDMAKFQFTRADAEQDRADIRAQRYQNMILAATMVASGAGTGTPTPSRPGAPPPNTVESSKADSGSSQAMMKMMMALMAGG
jgi:hypothetical protein